MLHLEYLMMAHDQERVKRAAWHVRVAESRRMQRDAREEGLATFRHRATGLLRSSQVHAEWATTRARHYQEGVEIRRRELIARLRCSADPCEHAT